MKRTIEEIQAWGYGSRPEKSEYMRQHINTLISVFNAQCLLHFPTCLKYAHVLTCLARRIRYFTIGGVANNFWCIVAFLHLNSCRPYGDCLRSGVRSSPKILVIYRALWFLIYLTSSYLYGDTLRGGVWRFSRLEKYLVICRMY